MMSCQLQSVWSDIHGRLDQILERRDRALALPESKLLPVPFSETKKTNQKKINSLLDSLSRSMLSSPAYDSILNIRSLEQKTIDLLDKERRLKNLAFSAPATRPSYRIDLATTDELRAKAAECAHEAAAAKQEIVWERQHIADELRAWGVELSPEQQELLFSSVIGDDMLKNSIILKNAKTILEHMADQIAHEGRDSGAAKRYYGAYLCFIDVLIASNRTTLDTIHKVWLPRLGTIINKAQEAKTAATKAMKSARFRSQQRQTFKANVEANTLTIKVGKLYGDFLSRQGKALERRLSELATDRAASQNTYDTVAASSDLTELIQCGLQDLDALGGVVLPEMHLFENFEQQREFAELSFRLAQAV